MPSNLTRVDELKHEIVRAAGLLFSGVMQHSGHANISARLDENWMVLTSKGTDHHRPGRSRAFQRLLNKQ